VNTAPGPGVRLAARMVAAVDVGDGPAEGEAEAGAVAFGRHEGLAKTVSRTASEMPAPLSATSRTTVGRRGGPRRAR